MDHRERVLAALDRRPVDRLPVDIWHTGEVYDALAKHFGVSDELELYRAMDLDKIVWRGIGYHAPEEGGGGRMDSTHYGVGRTLWGAELREVNTGLAVYHEVVAPPLAGYDTIESLDDYPYWPDPARFDYDGLVADLERFHPEFVTNAPWVSFFEIYCQMRGMENAMMDLLVDPDYVDAVLDRIEACQTAMMERLYARAAHIIDLTFISDDMGGQDNLLISKESWDRHFRDRMKRWCDLIHSYGIRVFYHSDGACAELVPRLLDVGIDVLNPIQHVCPGMDPAELKRKYGTRLSFHGGVDNQHVLTRGTVDDVRRETRFCLDTLGADGTGYVCASCHNIQPGTPVENVLAMVETVREAASFA